MSELPNRHDVTPVNFEPVDAIATTDVAELVAPNELAPNLELFKPRARQLVGTKDEVRTSLQASTIDGVFAAVFSNVTSGVLLTNFLLELGASSTEIGLLASIPMLANLMQPIGAYFSEQTTSRHNYCLWIYGISRSLWVGLAIAIFYVGRSHDAPRVLNFLRFRSGNMQQLFGCAGECAVVELGGGIGTPSAAGTLLWTAQ